MEAIVRSVNRDMKIVAEGKYEFRGACWRLVAWRVGSEWEGRKTAGKWYSLRGNATRDVGILKISRVEIPSSPEDPFGFWGAE